MVERVDGRVIGVIRVSTKNGSLPSTTRYRKATGVRVRCCVARIWAAIRSRYGVNSSLVKKPARRSKRKADQVENDALRKSNARLQAELDRTQLALEITGKAQRSWRCLPRARNLVEGRRSDSGDLRRALSRGWCAPQLQQLVRRVTSRSLPATATQVRASPTATATSKRAHGPRNRQRFGDPSIGGVLRAFTRAGVGQAPR